MREGWEYKKLGEVCEIARGGSPRPITEYITDDADGINWIKIGDAIEGDKYIRSTKEKIRPEGMKKSRLVHKGDFILSNSMSFGRPYIMDIDGCIHDGWLVLHDNKNTFNKDFLYYLLSSPVMYAQFERMAVGGVVNNLNSKLVSNVTVAIPPIPQQRLIVSELDEINSLIALKREQLKKYDELAQSLFYEMFGDPVENEKGWEVKKLGEVCIGKLKYGSGASAVDFDGRVRYVRITDIKEDGSLNNEAKSPSQIEDEYYLQEGDVLFARSGATVGKTYIHGTSNVTCLYAGYLIKAVPNQDVVLPLYLYNYTKSKFYRTWVDNNARAVAQPNINAKQYSNLPIPLPPLSLQQLFAQRIEQIEEQKKQITSALAKLETLLASRMQYWFE